MTGNESRTAHHLRVLASAQEADTSLLEQFVCETDAAAFAELVRRHGPMVLGVCRRVLGNDADAEDAFQATFLVLARKAGAVRKGSSVASWLFGVARFAALKARDRNRRRREHETRAARNPRPQTGPDTELLAAVDEELGQLPDRYRAPLVTCLLQGQTQEDAARRLSCSLSTLRRRLERGQELLRRRLAGRGLGTLAVGIGAKSAPVSAGAVEATTALAVALLKGEAGMVPATVLAQEVISMMSRTSLKVLLAALVVGIGLVGGGTAWRLTAQPKEPTQNLKAPPKAVPKTAPTAEPKGAPAAEPGDRIKVGDKLTIQAKEIFEQAPLDQIFEVDAAGRIDLTARYSGKMKVAGLTLGEASAAVTAQIRLSARRGEAKLSRFVPSGPIELENRVRALEKELKELRATVEELRAKKPGSGP